MPLLTSCDVCLVGLGPVGATLAALLGASGVRTVVMERETAPYSLPRAAHLDGEALRILAHAGVRPEGPDLDGFDLVDARGRLLLRGRPAEAPPPGFPAGRLIHQPSVETALRAALAGIPSVTVRLGAEVTAVEPGASGVTVRVSPEASGDTGAGAAGGDVRAALVVGCDGAWSVVRDAMGVGLEGGGFEQAWLVVDAVLRQRLALPDRLLQIADPHRPTTYVPFGFPRRRWEFRLRPGETPEAMTQPQTIRRLLAPHLPPEPPGLAHGAVEIERAAVYTFHDLIARRWRRGRLLLAGDAAHQMPPFLGQGLGQGIRDAWALAPLLARVVHDGAPLATLDAYERQRRPHVAAVVRQAVRLGRLTTLPQPLAAMRDGAMGTAHRVGPLHRALMDVRG